MYYLEKGKVKCSLNGVITKTKFGKCACLFLHVPLFVAADAKQPFPHRCRAKRLFEETRRLWSFAFEGVIAKEHAKTAAMDVDVAFVKSKRGILKVAELVR